MLELELFYLYFIFKLIEVVVFLQREKYQSEKFKIRTNNMRKNAYIKE